MDNKQEIFKEKVSLILDSVNKVLLVKNKKYGDSVLTPTKIFSKMESEDSIYQRLDDKLSRIKNSDEPMKNDVFDLIGYLILLCVKKGWTDFTELID